MLNIYNKHVETMLFFSYILYFLIAIFCINVCTCDNSRVDSLEMLRNTTQGKAIHPWSYLEKYGYLLRRDGNGSKDTAIPDLDPTHAVRMFQKFANLNESGIIDNQTSAVMSLPRCGFLDIFPNADRKLPLKLVNHKKWKSKVVKWKITSFSTKLIIAVQRQTIRQSFEHWTNNSGLIVKETMDNDADIDIKFVTGNHGDGDQNAFDGPGNTIAHAFLPPDGEVHFDDDETWTALNNNGTDLLMVAIHELGHALGLLHSAIRESIMAPFYRRYDPGFELHSSDVQAIQELYGPPKRSEPPITDTDVGVTGNKNSAVGNQTSHRRTFNICKARFDAICGGKDGHINIFVGRYVYKVYSYCLEGQNCVLEGYPKLISDVFKNGPKRVNAAAYIPDVRKRTYLFKGQKLWSYTGSKLDTGYPLKLKKIDLPFRPSAAYIQKTPYSDYQLYLFSGVYFWEMNLYTNKMASPLFYIDRYWNRMPRKPDAVLQTKDGNIYVFKGKYYRKFDHRRGITTKKRLKAPAWIGRQCGFSDKSIH